MLVNLQCEQADLMGHVRHVTITDDELAYVEETRAKIRTGLDLADFDARSSNYWIFAEKLPLRMGKRLYMSNVE